MNYDGTAIGFSEDPMVAGKGYGIEGTWWRENGGSWHAPNNSSPACLKPLADNQKVRLGVVRVAPTQEALGGEVVVWLECLD